MKNLAISAVCLAALAACGGGGSDPQATPAPSSTASTASALTLAQAFLASYDASLATSIPASGTTALALTDGCSLNNGTSKALAVSDYDADPLRVASQQYNIGSIRSAITITAERTTTNPNNTVRREIDVQYVIDYLDGTKDDSATQTLITGSSAGSTLADGSVCAASQDIASLRFLGNKKVANTFVNASNERLQRSLLASGLDATPPLTYNRYITLGVRDPAKIATYATISGPGLTAGGVAATFKMVSPRLLRDDPLFAGKNGNYVDWRDTDTFRVCRTATVVFAAADVADCVANGATGASWGHFAATDPSAQDTAFNALGVVAGGAYTVKLYSGVGWKTVNGQASETPIATYTSTLQNLPMSTVALAGTLAAPVNKFPELLTSTVTLPDIATNVRNKTAFSTSLTWAAPGLLPDGRMTGLNVLYSFEQGRASAGTALNPASRQTTPSFPASTALSATFNVPAPVTALVTPTYFEAGLEYTNRNGNLIRALQTLQ